MVMFFWPIINSLPPLKDTSLDKSVATHFLSVNNFTSLDKHIAKIFSCVVYKTHSSNSNTTVDHPCGRDFKIVTICAVKQFHNLLDNTVFER